MPYLSQVDALIYEARRYLALAEQATDSWPSCGGFLARSLEHATSAVFLAWGEPRAPAKKMHRHFVERLAPYINEGAAKLIQFIWEVEGQRQLDLSIQDLLAFCRSAVDYFATLAAGQTPADWVPLPIPEPIGWSKLSEAERQFLNEALALAAQWAPEVKLVLFGSRAAGTAGIDSDYDLLFIFPDETAEWQRGRSFAPVILLAKDRGIELSVPWSTKGDWLDPPEVSRPLIDRIKATGIMVPLSL